MAIASPKKKEELAKQFKINANLDAFIKTNPELVRYVKDLPREQIDRKFLLRKMKDQEQKESYTTKVKAWRYRRTRANRGLRSIPLAV